MSYIPHTSAEKEAILSELNCKTVDELFADIPPSLLKSKIPSEDRFDSLRILSEMKALASQNTAHRMNSFLGAGAYDHFIPSVISPLVNRGEFLTSYTPYQPEMSQGYLQAIFEYQTMICELTKADVSNASL